MKSVVILVLIVFRVLANLIAMRIPTLGRKVVIRHPALQIVRFHFGTDVVLQLVAFRHDLLRRIHLVEEVCAVFQEDLDERIVREHRTPQHRRKALV